MTVHCPCTKVHTPRRVVVTGGPGAGKTALLELIRQALCQHVRILPESAGVVFGGGFPARTTRRAAGLHNGRSTTSSGSSRSSGTRTARPSSCVTGARSTVLPTGRARQRTSGRHSARRRGSSSRATTR